jgi:hypothetical protein
MKGLMWKKLSVFASAEERSDCMRRLFALGHRKNIKKYYPCRGEAFAPIFYELLVNLDPRMLRPYLF